MKVTADKMQFFILSVSTQDFEFEPQVRELNSMAKLENFYVHLADLMEDYLTIHHDQQVVIMGAYVTKLKRPQK